MKYVEMRSGSKMPAFGLGTWKSEKGQVYTAIRKAIEIGYNHIDCAAIYGNEPEVGQALADSLASGDIARRNLWVTSKLWNDCHEFNNVRPACEKTLEDLKLDYLDLYLIHWPVAFKHGIKFPSSREDYLTLEEAPLQQTWEAMCELKAFGLVKHIGVSNMGKARIEMLAKVGEKPEVLQVEAHPHLPQTELLDYCIEEKIPLTAYSPLGSQDRVQKGDMEPSLLDDLVVKKIAQKHNITPGQVLIAWAIQRGTVVIPKSTSEGHLIQNFESLKVVLAYDDMNKLAKLANGFRYLTGTFFTGENSPYDIGTLFT